MIIIIKHCIPGYKTHALMYN